MSSVKPELERAGIPQPKPGLYDTRNVNMIKKWAKKVYENAKE